MHVTFYLSEIKYHKIYRQLVKKQEYWKLKLNVAKLQFKIEVKEFNQGKIDCSVSIDQTDSNKKGMEITMPKQDKKNT